MINKGIMFYVTHARLLFDSSETSPVIKWLVKSRLKSRDMTGRTSSQTQTWEEV
jgi:hypothetical protein